MADDEDIKIQVLRGEPIINLPPGAPQQATALKDAFSKLWRTLGEDIPVWTIPGAGLPMTPGATLTVSGTYGVSLTPVGEGTIYNQHTARVIKDKTISDGFNRVTTQLMKLIEDSKKDTLATRKVLISAVENFNAAVGDLDLSTVAGKTELLRRCQRTLDEARTAVQQMTDVANGRPAINIDGPGAAPGEVTPQQLQTIMSQWGLSEQDAREWAPIINKAMADGKLTTREQRAQFLAQMAIESKGLTTTYETPNTTPYRDGSQYDPGTSSPGAGNVLPGDGHLYRGRGIIQLTGRGNYDAAGKALGIPLVDKPELAAEPEIAAKVAIWYWTTHNVPAVGGDVTAATAIVNGGDHNLAERQQMYNKILQTLG